MIYDCFAFFNELDLLEIRLNELDGVVDKFVIVEATRTFQKKPKPLYFQENRERFAAFEHKIIYVLVDRYPNFFSKFRIPNAWDYDNYQKEQILQGLKECKPDDIIIVSDLDEIPDPQKITDFKDKPGVKVFQQYVSYYFLNYVCTHHYDYGGKAISQKNENGFGFWRGSVMLDYKDIRTIKKTRSLRDIEDKNTIVIREGGWHFSYMGGIQKIIQKIESWAHKEYNIDRYKDPAHIEEVIRKGEYLFDDEMKFELVNIMKSELPFPLYIKDNQEKYASLIKEF